MRVMVAGASGVIGRTLLPMLLREGHEVTGISNVAVASDDYVHIQVDATNLVKLKFVTRAERPDVIVNLLTALPITFEAPRHRSGMETTNWLRSRANDAFAIAAPSARIISESVAYYYAPTARGLADEDRPFWMDGPATLRPAIAALQLSEAAVRRNSGVSLRLGHLCGPGTQFAHDGPIVRAVHRRRIPLVADRTSTLSFVHVADAARAIMTVFDSDVSGEFNVVDDDPVTAEDWLLRTACQLGARAPRIVPERAARRKLGEWGTAFMAHLVGADGRKARESLGWRPAAGGWRQGLVPDSCELAIGSDHPSRPWIEDWCS